MSNQPETRTVTSLRPGTKVALMVAAGFLAVAAYFYLTPTASVRGGGGLFGCGSPMQPNSGALGRDQCQIVEGAALHRALLFLALALITAGLGALFFGADRSTQQRVAGDRFADDDDDEEFGVRDRSSSLLAGRSERSRASGGAAPRRSRFLDDDEDVTPRREHGEDDVEPVDDPAQARRR